MEPLLMQRNAGLK